MNTHFIRKTLCVISTVISVLCVSSLLAIINVAKAAETEPPKREYRTKQDRINASMANGIRDCLSEGVVVVTDPITGKTLLIQCFVHEVKKFPKHGA